MGSTVSWSRREIQYVLTRKYSEYNIVKLLQAVPWSGPDETHSEMQSRHDHFAVFLLLLIACVSLALGMYVLLPTNRSISRLSPRHAISLAVIPSTSTASLRRVNIPSNTYLNDDYCDDLADGLDEPMTSACAGFKLSVFRCVAGERTVPSSRVHDGINPSLQFMYTVLRSYCL